MNTQSKTLEYRTIKNQIDVYVDGTLWQTWDRNATTEAIAADLVSPPADLEMALRNFSPPA